MTPEEIDQLAEALVKKLPLVAPLTYQPIWVDPRYVSPYISPYYEAPQWWQPGGSPTCVTGTTNTAYEPNGANIA